MTRSSRSYGHLVFADINQEVPTQKRKKRETKRGEQQSIDQERVEDIQEQKEEETENLQPEAVTIVVPECTLRQLVKPDITQQLLCIVHPATIAPFELKTGLIHLLPQFKGSAREDPHKHLKESHIYGESK